MPVKPRKANKDDDDELLLLLEKRKSKSVECVTMHETKENESQCGAEFEPETTSLENGVKVFQSKMRDKGPKRKPPSSSFNNIKQTEEF